MNDDQRDLDRIISELKASSDEQAPDDSDGEYVRETFELTEEAIEIIRENAVGWGHPAAESIRLQATHLYWMWEANEILAQYPEKISYNPRTPRTADTVSFDVALRRKTAETINEIANEKDISRDDVLEIAIRDEKIADERRAERREWRPDPDEGTETGDEMPHPPILL